MMTNRKIHKIFISHEWKQNSMDHYFELVSLLNSIEGFFWENCSVLAKGPFRVGSEYELTVNLKQAIISVDVVLALIDSQYQCRKWSMTELEIAANLNKPIVAVRSKRTSIVPLEIINSVSTIVDWDAEIIADAINNTVYSSV